MLMLASANDTLLERWRSSLGETCRKASDASSLAEALRAKPSALVLLHLVLPGLGGVEGVTALHKAWPDAPLLVLSDLPAEQEGRALMRHGIRGYANAHINARLLAKAVRVIRRGEVWVGRRLMQHLIEELTHQEPLHPSLESLTPREREVADLVATGLCNKRVAQRLSVSERTVKAHMTAILQKTGAGDRLALALLVKGHGLHGRPALGS